MAVRGTLSFCRRHYFRHISKYKNFQMISGYHSQSTKSSNKLGSETSEEQTHFGFETVSESAKEEKVYGVFERVAETYDLMNDVMSVGIHRLWKDYFVEQLAPTQGMKLIDVAGGTGDIAFRLLKYVKNEKGEESDSDWEYNLDIPQDLEASSTSGESSSDNSAAGHTHVTVCDINQAMLDVGKRRAQEAGYKSGLSWLKGNAECLPVADNVYDAHTIAFGIRNCTHVDRVLSEAYRVLKPGGRFMCLEFSYVPNPILRKLYDEYSFQVIPVMGQVIASDWKSYQYLVESIRKFPDQEKFSSMIREAGFKAVKYENLLFGVAVIHSGFKL